MQQPLECGGRTCGRGSDRGPPLGRRRRLDNDRRVPADALTTRARVAIAQGEPEQAERDAHDALALGAEIEAYLFVPDMLECLAALAGQAGSHREAARLFGAATPSGSAWARSASRSRTRATRPRWQRCEMPWARRTLTPPGPRAPPCPPRRRSPTRSAAVANANARQRLGIADADRARCRPARQRRAGQQGHRHKAFRLTAHRADPPDPRLHQTRPDLARTARPGSCSPHLNYRARPAAICAFALMFCGTWCRMLASMSEIDPRADTPLVNWSELGVSGLFRRAR